MKSLCLIQISYRSWLILGSWSNCTIVSTPVLVILSKTASATLTVSHAWPWFPAVFQIIVTGIGIRFCCLTTERSSLCMKGGRRVLAGFGWSLTGSQVSNRLPFEMLRNDLTNDDGGDLETACHRIAV